jgi:selenide,water dikinase
MTHVVLVGAGHAHVQVLKRFGVKPVSGMRLTLVTRKVHTPYSGMLPGLIAGHYSFEDVHIDTRPLARFAGATLITDAVTGIDLAAKQILRESGPPVSYDLLSLDAGSTPNTDAVPGAEAHAVPVKPIDGFLERFERLRERVLAGGADAHVALVGDGAGGVELMLSVERRLRRDVAMAGRDPGRLRFTLVGAAERILPDFPAAASRHFEAVYAQRGIDVISDTRVTRVEKDRLNMEGRAPLAADEILWVTEARAPGWLKASGLSLDERGFLCVDENLRALGQRDIFAAGDMIAFTPRRLPKSGVYAVRAGPVLAENIRRHIGGQPLTAFKPQRTAMYLISTGEKHAIGTRNGFVASGRWVWWFKDWIDRRFMARFKDLPVQAGAVVHQA